jgi:hypothetical protein
MYHPKERSEMCKMFLVGESRGRGVLEYAGVDEGPERNRAWTRSVCFRNGISGGILQTYE